MIVVFDSRCNLCIGYVQFLMRHDCRGRLDFVAAGSDRGRDIMVASGQSPDDPATMIVIDRDVRLLRSDAALAGIAALGGAWRGVLLAQIVPRGWRDAIYRGVARRRYRWFGGVAACAACDASRVRP